MPFSTRIGRLDKVLKQQRRKMSLASCFQAQVGLGLARLASALPELEYLRAERVLLEVLQPVMRDAYGRDWLNRVYCVPREKFDGLSFQIDNDI